MELAIKMKTIFRSQHVSIILFLPTNTSENTLPRTKNAYEVHPIKYKLILIKKKLKILLD